MRLEDIDPVKCPRLYAAVQRSQARENEGWAKVAELKREGRDGAAARLVRKLLGVKPKNPMTDEQKEERRRYNEEHKEEIAERRKQERLIRRRTIALLTTGRRVRR
jgi:hypothetical protein